MSIKKLIENHKKAQAEQLAKEQEAGRQQNEDEKRYQLFQRVADLFKTAFTNAVNDLQEGGLVAYVLQGAGSYNYDAYDKADHVGYVHVGYVRMTLTIESATDKYHIVLLRVDNPSHLSVLCWSKNRGKYFATKNSSLRPEDILARPELAAEQTQAAIGEMTL